MVFKNLTCTPKLQRVTFTISQPRTPRFSLKLFKLLDLQNRRTIGPIYKSAARTGISANEGGHHYQVVAANLILPEVSYPFIPLIYMIWIWIPCAYALISCRMLAAHTKARVIMNDWMNLSNICSSALKWMPWIQIDLEYPCCEGQAWIVRIAEFLRIQGVCNAGKYISEHFHQSPHLL